MIFTPAREASIVQARLTVLGHRGFLSRVLNTRSSSFNVIPSMARSSAFFSLCYFSTRIAVRRHRAKKKQQEKLIEERKAREETICDMLVEHMCFESWSFTEFIQDVQEDFVVKQGAVAGWNFHA